MKLIWFSYFDIDIYIYILIVLMHMVQILNISDKTAISTISSLCNADPSKKSRPLINPGRGWSSLATPVTFFVSWPVWWFASTACRKSLVPTGFASAARKKLATGRDLVEPGNHVEDLLHFPHSQISADLNRLRRDYEEWFFCGHSRIVPRLNCDYLTRHDNAGGRSHGQLHGGLWPGKQFLG